MHFCPIWILTASVLKLPFTLSLYRKELSRESSEGFPFFFCELFISIDVNREQKVFGFLEMLIKVTMSQFLSGVVKSKILVIALLAYLINVEYYVVIVSFPHQSFAFSFIRQR